ncbi:MAG: hypothetical protein PHC34_13330 [Candidatus Gastranaerophilales bacterium]|nr:hypothetical protein [Candidatus Gastranaerophilales bacterium]
MTHETNLSIASNDRISELITEAENELSKIKPEIEYLEQCQKKLRDMKDQQFKLNSLIISLKGVMKFSGVNNSENVILDNNDVKIKNKSLDNDVITVNVNSENIRKIFMPDQAYSQVKKYLRTKNNMNYEIYKAVVFNSGSATTQEIKNYLIENGVKQPKTGKGFEKIELKEISSRANYLVRKSVLISTEPGHFRSVFGWCEIE